MVDRAAKLGPLLKVDAKQVTKTFDCAELWHTKPSSSRDGTHRVDRSR